jgi:hypothetical protein
MRKKERKKPSKYMKVYCKKIIILSMKIRNELYIIAIYLTIMISLITYSARVAQATNDSFKKPKKEI